MKKTKVIVLLDRYHLIFKRIPELLSEEIDFAFMWVGHFSGWRLFVIFPKMLYYRLKGFRVVHFQWLEMYYQDRSFPKSALFAFVMLAGSAVLKLCGYRIVWTCHNVYPHENIHPSLTKAVRRGFVKLCDHILVMHKSMMPAIRREFGYEGGSSLIRGGCYDEPYAGSRAEARQSLGLPQDSFVIVSIGNMRKYKNLDLLVKSFLKISPAVRGNMRLVIAGRASDKSVVEEVKRLSSGIPEILLFPSDEPLALARYVAASDIMVLTQTMESVSANIHLAAAYGIPVLTTKESGATFGLVMEYGLGEACELTVDCLGDNVLKLYRDREALAGYSGNAKSFVAEDTWEKSARTHLEVYSKPMKR